MAKKSMIAKAKREPKFSTRQHNRCTRCGKKYPPEFIRDSVLPKMAALRAPRDAAEKLIPAKSWPFPTYAELMFGVK